MVVILACFAAKSPGHLTAIESTTNSSVYQSFLDSNVRPLVQQLKLTQILEATESRCCYDAVKVQTKVIEML